jgi:hypothetical protein
MSNPTLKAEVMALRDDVQALRTLVEAHLPMAGEPTVEEQVAALRTKVDLLTQRVSDSQAILVNIAVEVGA